MNVINKYSNVFFPKSNSLFKQPINIMLEEQIDISCKENQQYDSESKNEELSDHLNKDQNMFYIKFLCHQISMTVF